MRMQSTRHPQATAESNAAARRGKLTGAMLGDECVLLAGAGSMTIGGVLFETKSGDEGGRLVGDSGSRMVAATWSTTTTARRWWCPRAAGAGELSTCGADDAAEGGGAGWLPATPGPTPTPSTPSTPSTAPAPAPALTNSSTSDGRGFRRGRSPSCIPPWVQRQSNCVVR